MSCQLHVQCFNGISYAFVHMLPYSFLNGFPFHFQLLPACSMQYTILTPVTCCVVVRKSKKIKGLLCSLVSAKGQYPAFLLRGFKAKLLQSLNQKLIKPLCFILVLKQVYKVICIAYHVHFTLKFMLFHIIKPCIQVIVQIHICQHW